MNYIIKLVRLLDARYKYRLLSLILFSILVSVIEVVGISAIMPFIDVATNFEKIHSNEYYQWAYVFFGFDSDSDFAIAFGLTLLGFYLFRGLVNLLHTYKVASFAQNIYTRITKRLFRAYLLMPYQEFTGKNSSYLSKTIITETSLLSVVIRDVLVMLSEILVVIFLYILMLLASWKITFTFTIVLAVKLFFLTQTVSKQNKLVGAVRV